MKQIKLTVPRLSDKYMLYVYRSSSPSDINTIEKVKESQPILSIDEAITIGDEYEVYDSPNVIQADGVQYYGPAPNTLPVTEYEMNIGQIMLARDSYANTLSLSPLAMPYGGVMMYYSIIGVDLTTNVITHLSKVNGVFIEQEYQEGTVDVYSCSQEDQYAVDAEWEYVGNFEWDNTVRMGDCTNEAQWQRWGSVMAGIVPSIDPKECAVQTRMISSSGFCVLELQNPWWLNNEAFNFKRLKSYKLRNVLGNSYGEFSEPTYKTLLPTPIERMTILCSFDTEDQEPIPFDTEDENIYKVTIIRKNGIYYDSSEHKRLGVNRYNIPFDEQIAVFNESSTQEKIKIQVPCMQGVSMNVTMYLEDAFNISEPSVFYTEEL